MSAALKQRLARGEVVLADGAMGTLLMAAGLAPGEAPEAWNLSRLDTVAGVAAAYADAGAEIVTTNSFGASPLKLAAHGLEGRAVEINRAAAAAARRGAAGRALVSGSIGPCGGLLAPLGDIPAGDAARGFREQAEALIEGGADLLCVETMIDLEEAVLAVKAARAALPDGVVMASLTFEPTPRGWFTVMGNGVADAAAALEAAGADVVGGNCGQGVAGMIEVARAFAAATDLPLLIQANAGLPVLENGAVHYPETPAQTAAAVPDLLAAGVRVLGGCCGTTPEHIAAMRRALDAGSTAP